MVAGTSRADTSLLRVGFVQHYSLAGCESSRLCGFWGGLRRSMMLKSWGELRAARASDAGRVVLLDPYPPGRRRGLYCGEEAEDSYESDTGRSWPCGALRRPCDCSGNAEAEPGFRTQRTFRVLWWRNQPRLCGEGVHQARGIRQRSVRVVRLSADRLGGSRSLVPERRRVRGHIWARLRFLHHRAVRSKRMAMARARPRRSRAGRIQFGTERRDGCVHKPQSVVRDSQIEIERRDNSEGGRNT